MVNIQLFNPGFYTPASSVHVAYAPLAKSRPALSSITLSKDLRALERQSKDHTWLPGHGNALAVGYSRVMAKVQPMAVCSLHERPVTNRARVPNREGLQGLTGKTERYCTLRTFPERFTVDI